MISPTENQKLPENKHSKRKFQFECDCGKIFETIWQSYAIGKTKSCGSCKLFIWKKSGKIKFGQLTLLTHPDKIKRLIDETLWECSCGTKKQLKLLNVLNGQTKSCGCLRKQSGKTNRYDPKSKDCWLSEIPNLVNKNLPISWGPGSGRIFSFKCDCGKIFERKFNRFSDKSRCGKCFEQFVKKGTKIGNFVYDGESQILKTNSTGTVPFICSCKRKELLKIREVFSGYKKICGKCNLISEKELKNRKFGNLKMKFPREIKKYSGEKILWLCDCSNEVEIEFSSVSLGRTGTCGNCREEIQNWYTTNIEQIKELKCPVPSGKILNGIEALETIKNVSKPFKALCPVCSSIYFPRLHGIKLGESLTCGCTSNIISLAAKEISTFIQSLGLDTELEYKVENFKYDIYVPKPNLLIEFHGLKWHSSPESKKRDKAKYEKAVEFGHNYLAIFEDEWKYKKDAVKGLIKNRAQKATNLVRLRPKQCILKQPTMKEADTLFEQFHYIGKTKSRYSYGAWYGDKLIACVSFKRPTRQSKHDFELVRMVSHPNFRIHGIWNKLLKLFVQDHSPKSIVSFSDNRLFPGGVYEKIGFRLDGKVAADYYWAKNKKRHHKSGLRKKPGEIGTETQLREAEGYRKIWDLGKKRWVMDLTNEH